MLSPETLEQYRRMTPGERLRLTLFLCQGAWKALGEGAPERVHRRYERLHQENELRNTRITAGLMLAESKLSNENR